MAFKTLEWVRRVRDSIYEDTKQMSWQERREYFAREAKLARQRAQATRIAHAPGK